VEQLGHKNILLDNVLLLTSLSVLGTCKNRFTMFMTVHV